MTQRKKGGGWSPDRLEGFRQFMDSFASHSRGLAQRRSDVWEPPMDVYETHEAVVIKMSLPGVKPGDVRVRFDGDTVTISGHRVAPREPGMVAYHLMEIRNGYFERSVVVRRPIDPQGTGAQYEAGFLWIRIPKVQARVHHVYCVNIRL